MRTRRIASFAAPFVCVVAATACDRPAGAGGDDTPEIDGWPGTENPPPPTLGTECWVQPPPPQSSTDCQWAVCSMDATCCTTAWDDRCVDLAGAYCSLYRTCADAVLVATGPTIERVTLAPPAQVATLAEPLADDGSIRAIAVGYSPWDGSLVAIASECTGRVLRDPGAFDAVFELVTEHSGGPEGCADAAPEERWQGRAARWADLDGDGALDAVFAGVRGAWWARRVPPSGGWVHGGEIVPAEVGRLSDLALFDVDLDGDLDAIVTFEDGPARVYRHGEDGFAPDAWTSALAGHGSVAVCDLAGDAAQREVVVGGPAGVEAYRLGPDGVAGPAWGDSAVVAAVPGATHVACGRVGDALSTLVAHGVDGAIRAVVAGELVWSSLSDVDPPVAFPGAGVVVRSGLAVIADATAEGDRPYAVLAESAGGALMPSSGTDPTPDAATTAIAVLPDPP